MSVYVVRSETGRLPELTGGATDTLFVNERFDAETLPSGTYEHCTFANISFKDATFEDTAFIACVFESCYFRGTVLARCRFPASRFIDCEFIKPTIKVSDFSYARFIRCAPPFRELSVCLPGPANLRAELTANLAIECEFIGQTGDARHFRIAARKARERDLRGAAFHESEYYKTHYDAFGRLAAAQRLVLSRLNRTLWGYGERATVLLRNLALLVVLVFPVLFLLAGADVARGPAAASYWDCLLLSIASLVNASGVTGLTVTGIARVWILAETGVGLVVLGLYVSYLLHWIARR
jgi:hypothetical protein